MQATSHSLKQWWLVQRRIYASLGLNELRVPALETNKQIQGRCSIPLSRELLCMKTLLRLHVKHWLMTIWKTENKYVFSYGVITVVCSGLNQGYLKASFSDPRCCCTVGYPSEANLKLKIPYSVRDFKAAVLLRNILNKWVGLRF